MVKEDEYEVPEIGAETERSAEIVGNWNEAFVTRGNIVAWLDDAIDQMISIRKTLVAVFVSAIFVAPIALILSVYIFTHAAFDEVIDAQDNFGEVLEVMLVMIIIVSSIWIVSGIKQFRSMRLWDKRYEEYLVDHDEIDQKIGLDHAVSNEI